MGMVSWSEATPGLCCDESTQGTRAKSGDVYFTKHVFLKLTRFLVTVITFSFGDVNLWRCFKMMKEAINHASSASVWRRRAALERWIFTMRWRQMCVRITFQSQIQRQSEFASSRADPGSWIWYDFGDNCAVPTSDSIHIMTLYVSSLGRWLPCPWQAWDPRCFCSQH